MHISSALKVLSGARPASSLNRFSAAAAAWMSAMCACLGIQSGPGKLPASPAT